MESEFYARGLEYRPNLWGFEPCRLCFLDGKSAEPATSQSFRLHDRSPIELLRILRRSFQQHRAMAYTAWFDHFDHSSQHQPGLFDKVGVYSGDRDTMYKGPPTGLYRPADSHQSLIVYSPCMHFITELIEKPMVPSCHQFLASLSVSP